MPLSNPTGSATRPDTRIAFRAVGGVLSALGVGWIVTWGSLVASASKTENRPFWIGATWLAVFGIALGIILLVVGESAPEQRQRDHARLSRLVRSLPRLVRWSRPEKPPTHSPWNVPPRRGNRASAMVLRDSGPEDDLNPFRSWGLTGPREPYRMQTRCRPHRLIFWPESERASRGYTESEVRVSEDDLEWTLVASDGTRLLTIHKFFDDGFSLTEHVTTDRVIVVLIICAPTPKPPVGPPRPVTSAAPGSEAERRFNMEQPKMANVLRRELDEALAIDNRLPLSDQRGTARAAAVASGLPIPPDRSEIQAWASGVESYLNVPGYETLLAKFKDAATATSDPALLMPMVTGTADQAAQMHAWMKAKIDALTEIVQILDARPPILGIKVEVAELDSDPMRLKPISEGLWIAIGLPIRLVVNRSRTERVCLRFDFEATTLNFGGHPRLANLKPLQPDEVKNNTRVVANPLELDPEGSVTARVLFFSTVILGKPAATAESRLDLTDARVRVTDELSGESTGWFSVPGTYERSQQ